MNNNNENNTQATETATVATPVSNRGRKPSQHVKLTIGELVNKYWNLRTLVKDFPVVSGSTRPMTAGEVQAAIKKLPKDSELDLTSLVVRTGGATFGELVEGCESPESFTHEQADQEIDLNVTALRKLATEKALSQIEKVFA